jgi:dipeptidyl aminopeptidase/acylaminoacyl peptidase
MGQSRLKPLNLDDNATWKQRYRASKIAWADIASQDPDRGLACTDIDGILQLYAWDVPTGKLTRITDEPVGVMRGMISADGKCIYYHKDKQGNEIGHFVRVPFEGGKEEDVTPDAQPYAFRHFAQGWTGNVLAATIARKGGFRVYTMAGGNEPQLVYASERLVGGLALSAAGEIAVVASSERSGTLDFVLLAFDLATGDQIAELSDGPETSVRPGRFSPLPGDMRLFATSSKSGYARPLLWNPRTGERQDLSIDGIAGEVTPWDWSPDGKRILLNQLHQARHQLYIYDVESGTTTKLNHPAGVLGGFTGAAFAADGRILTTWQDATHPSRLIALDGATGEQTGVVLQAGEVPGGHPWESITFTSETGEAIQGWLSRPAGDGPFPTILHTHGGPTSVMPERFFPAAQAWLDHGFAFLTINYHGSTTFGKAFEKSILGNLGDLEVADMAAAYRWLVDNNVADAAAVFLTGGSYGGYLTLQAIGRRPELWAGGMATVAIGDWKLMYEDQAETLRGYQRALFKGTPQETPEATAASSPITYAESIKAPILVIQGSNDTRCPARQMKVYEEKLRSLDKSITVHWFDAGHGSRAQEQQIEHQELMMRFAYDVLQSS